MPATGSDDINSGISGEAQASCSSRPSCCAVTRSTRESPDPLSIVGGSPPMRSRHQARKVSREPSRVPMPFCCRLKVRNNCCAITLLLYLLMSRTISASAGDCTVKVGRRPAGTRPSRTCPVSLPPISAHIPATARAAKPLGSANAIGQTRSPQAPG